MPTSVGVLVHSKKPGLPETAARPHVALRHSKVSQTSGRPAKSSAPASRTDLPVGALTIMNARFFFIFASYDERSQRFGLD